ncbi:MAG: ABC-type transport auxiliary lipoprotein family protein [Bacteroidota bacterium]|nr:ABC-type transport auxiliary lipoprotein family protein [Bacteroidota bacterium]
MKANLYVTIGMLLILSGCLSEQAIIKKHYIIEWQSDQESSNNESFEAIQGSCQITQIEISPVFERTQIVNRSGSHEITYYKYHQWAVRPSVPILEIIENYMESSGTFESISTRYSRKIPDYRLTTKIHQLEVIESSDAFSAHVNIEFRIINNSNNQVLLNHRSDKTETLPAKDLNLFARTVSNILIAELQTFTSLIETQRSTFEQETE